MTLRNCKLKERERNKTKKNSDFNKQTMTLVLLTVIIEFKDINGNIFGQFTKY